MAKARWLAREGRVAEAETAYRGVLATHPDLKPCWAEYFELLRSHGRLPEALRVAEGAEGQFGDAAFPLTLKGAALIELSRYREALATLERAVGHDPDLALAWHELGLAAYRLGERNRALLALDRAFALEPHTETLKLRGRILRDAGRYAAAEVAFEGAAQAAEHDEQRVEAEAEIRRTQRFGFYAPRKPDDLAPAERWFAETGAVILAPTPGPVAPSDEVLATGFGELASDSGWRFGQVVALGPTLPVWSAVADGLDAPLTGKSGFDAATIPLVVAVRPLPADPAWGELTDAVRAENSGLVLVLEHPAGGDTAADIVGVLVDGAERRPRIPDVARALALAQHPASRLAGRRLSP